jgi:streptogramin lyase
MESSEKDLLTAKLLAPALRISERGTIPRERGATMILKLNGNTGIDNLRNYPADIVAKLRALLAAGARAYPDPKRKEFYDVENGSRMFYIHISTTGSVWLLASWIKNPAPLAEA